MGRLLNSLLSGSSGTVGRLVVANVFGNEILRVRPQKRTGEASAKQQLIQLRMDMGYNFLLPYIEFAKLYFGVRSGMKSRYNQAMSNVLNAFKLHYVLNVITPVYSEIEFARGSLLGAVPTGLTSTVAQTFTLDWFDNSGGNVLRQTDQIQVLYVGDGEFRPVMMDNVATRLDASLDIPVPPNMQGKTLHVWVAFRSLDLKDVSLSTYVGTVLII